MGNKRALLPWLVEILFPYLDPNAKLLDLFAGTSSVGYAFKPYTTVIANDIQQYSSTISEALLLFEGNIESTDYDLMIKKNFLKNLVELKKIFNEQLKLEKKLLSSKQYDEYFEFCGNAPLLGREINKRLDIYHYFSPEYQQFKHDNPHSFPYLLFSCFYSHTFFSLRQAIEIDSLRYAISLVEDKLRRSVYLSALMSAINKAVSSTGHFAQHLNPHSTSSVLRIVKYREISVLKKFIEKLADFQKLHICQKSENEVYNLDYRDLVISLKKTGKLDDVGLIYIDPPYTSAQYSRYYHIPETLVKYDYPFLTASRQHDGVSTGRYRNDRHNSTFSHITSAEKSFDELFKLLSENSKATLAVSYSDNSLVSPIDELIKIAEKYYKVSNVKNGYIHSAQGSKFTSNGKGAKDIHEHIIICQQK